MANRGSILLEHRGWLWFPEEVPRVSAPQNLQQGRRLLIYEERNSMARSHDLPLIWKRADTLLGQQSEHGLGVI